MKFDMIVCGAAGQGIITIAKVFARAAATEGFDTRSVAYFGIAKTEGPVSAHVRIGTPAGPSPKIRRGTAEAMIGLDRLEALRQAHYLSGAAMVLLDVTGSPPVYSRISRSGYPSKEETEAALAGRNVIWVPAAELARKAGSRKLAGAVMLGALSALRPLVDRDHLVMSLRSENPKIADAEAEAFFLGVAYVTGKDV